MWAALADLLTSVQTTGAHTHASSHPLVLPPSLVLPPPHAPVTRLSWSYMGPPECSRSLRPRLGRKSASSSSTICVGAWVGTHR